jgi:DNA helicase HerA-like ATPase
MDNIERLREALTECIDTLALVEHPRMVDPNYGEEVRHLGDRIGYGALMSSASASWRNRLKEDGNPVGGEFVAGPCYATVLRTLRIARAALSGR